MTISAIEDLGGGVFRQYFEHAAGTSDVECVSAITLQAFSIIGGRIQSEGVATIALKESGGSRFSENWTAMVGSLGIEVDLAKASAREGWKSTTVNTAVDISRSASCRIEGHTLFNKLPG